MPATNDKDLQEEVVKRINDFNMTIVAFGDPIILRNWVKAAPRKNYTWYWNQRCKINDSSSISRFIK